MKSLQYVLMVVLPLISGAIGVKVGSDLERKKEQDERQIERMERQVESLKWQKAHQDVLSLYQSTRDVAALANRKIVELGGTPYMVPGGAGAASVPPSE